MKWTRWRSHKVNMGNYESTEFGASVAFDDEIDKLPKEYKPEEVWQYLEDELDEALAIPAQGAVDSGAINDSHIHSRYDVK